MVLVFYRLNSAIERGTKPDALGWKPCHWTKTLKAAAIPANRPDVLCDDDVGAICWRVDLNLALMSMPKRPNLSASRAENPPQAPSGHTSPVTNGNRRVVLLTSQTNAQGLRRIREDHRVGLFETNIERFQQLPHRIEAIIIEQRSHPLPQQPLAAKLRPHSPKQGTTELLCLIHQKRDRK